MDSITNFGGFRTHILIPHKVVGSIIDWKPTWPGMHFDGVGYIYDNELIMSATKKQNTLTVTAHKDIWLQEPGLTVEIAGFSGQSWIRGYNIAEKKYTSHRYFLTHKDAHKSTVHFSRYPRWKYTDAVEVCSTADGFKWNKAKTLATPQKYLLGSLVNEFESLLLNTPERIRPADWHGCQVFGRDMELIGVSRGFEMIRRWELAGKEPDIAQMHFLGWTGGAGAVTDELGKTPPSPAPEGFDFTPYRFLWQPRSWRLLRKGERISQSLWLNT